MGQPLIPFALDGSARHLCIDMQRLFAEDTPWQVPWLPRVLPCVRQIAQRHPALTIFTRFIPPETSEVAVGAWRDYYKVWWQLTRHELAPDLLDLVEPLGHLVPPAKVVDKPANSAFSRRGFAAALRRSSVTTLIITGGETDVCVLATVMDAVDYGFRVVLPTDALCSSRDQTHDALLSLYRERFTQQIEAAMTEDVLSRW